MGLISLSTDEKVTTDNKYLTFGKLYLIKPTRKNTVSLGERFIGKYLELNIKDLKSLHEFIRSILILKFSNKDSHFVSRSVYYGVDPRIYFTYTKDDKTLDIGIYDEGNITVLNLDDILKLKIFLSTNISKIIETEDLPF